MRLQRMCGKRVAGIYLVTNLHMQGSPMEHFMMCPPQPMPDYMLTELGIAAQGMSIVKTGDAHHVFDWVGENNYPFVPDFIAEGRRYGFSRKIPRTADFSKLRKGKSRHLLIHPKAIIGNPDVYYNKRMDPPVLKCPKGHETHDDPQIEYGNPMCLGLLWEAMRTSGEDVITPDKRLFRRKIVSAQYEAGKILPGTEFEAGLFMWLPITQIEIIRDPVTGEHEELLELIEDSGTTFDVKVLDE